MARRPRFTVQWGKRPTANGREVSCPVIDDDDFTHDAVLYVAGDFYDQETAMKYAQRLADAMNQVLPREEEREYHTLAEFHRKQKEEQQEEPNRHHITYDGRDDRLPMKCEKCGKRFGSMTNYADRAISEMAAANEICTGRRHV